MAFCPELLSTLYRLLRNADSPNKRLVYLLAAVGCVSLGNRSLARLALIFSKTLLVFLGTGLSPVLAVCDSQRQQRDAFAGCLRPLVLIYSHDIRDGSGDHSKLFFPGTSGDKETISFTLAAALAVVCALAPVQSDCRARLLWGADPFLASFVPTQRLGVGESYSGTIP